MKALSVLLLFIILFFCGCKKLIDIDRNYIGEWRGGSASSSGRSVFFTVSDDGTAHFERINNSAVEERWSGRLKSTGKRFQIGPASPWFVIIQNPVHTDESVYPYWHDSLAYSDNWIIKFRYPKTIGYDGWELIMYRNE